MGIVVNGQPPRRDDFRIQLRRVLSFSCFVWTLKIDQIQTEAGPANAFTNVTSEIIARVFTDDVFYLTSNIVAYGNFSNRFLIYRNGDEYMYIFENNSKAFLIFRMNSLFLL